MRIINGNVYLPDCRFLETTVTIREGRFTETDTGTSGRYRCDPLRETTIDASGCYVIPGLIDIHFHGCMGADFCDGTTEAIRTLAVFEAREGITAICPATLTLAAEELKGILSCAADYRAGLAKEAAEQGGDAKLADLVGINMEGPFISHAKKGAQNEKYILPCDRALCKAFLEASRGLVKIIGLAPEANPDFAGYIEGVKDRVRVSLAHTNADYETALAAFRAGAVHAVHLFNAMPEMTHREPGVVGAVRDCPHVMAELICDGNHVHPSVVRAAFAMLGAERIVLISDSLRATGMGDGRMLLGGQEVIVQGTRATLAEGGSLAGSVCTLMQCMQIAVQKMGIPLENAVRCASYNPAKAIGIEEDYGSIAPGKRANAVLLDQRDLRVRMVIKDGVVLRSAP